jgi:hypothetical protein
VSTGPRLPIFATFTAVSPLTVGAVVGLAAVPEALAAAVGVTGAAVRAALLSSSSPLHAALASSARPHARIAIVLSNMVPPAPSLGAGIVADEK